jgi:large subunit ribosomal protein L31
MKKGIHPDYHELNVVTTDGNLDVDPSSHPAWTGVHRLIDSGGQLSKFSSRFKNFGLKS